MAALCLKLGGAEGQNNYFGSARKRGRLNTHGPTQNTYFSKEFEVQKVSPRISSHVFLYLITQN